MKTMTRAALLFLFLPAAAQAWPLDHLEPWPAGDYKDEVSKKFKDAFAPNMRLLGTVDAPMDKDVAIGMQVEEGRYAIVAWAVTPGGSGPTNCEAGIPASTGARIDRAWRLMIDGAGPDERAAATGIETVGVDGIFFFFSRSEGGKLSVASAWTPPDGSRPAALADLMSAMSEFCLTPGKSILDRLDRQTSDLLARLETDRK